MSLFSTRGSTGVRRSIPARLALMSAATVAAATTVTNAALTLDFQLTNGSHLKALSAADVNTNITINVYVDTVGSDGTTTDDGLQSLQLRILANQLGGGASNGTLTGTSRNSPFAGSGSSVGTSQDLNGDGNADIGGTNGDSGTADYFNPRAAGITAGTQFLVGTLTYHVNSLASTGTTVVTGGPRNGASGTAIRAAGAWMIDGTAKNFAAGADTFSVNSLTFAAAPAVTGPVIRLTSSAGAPTGQGNRILNGTSGADTGTFLPNAPVADSVNVTGTGGGYLPGYLDTINGGAGQTSGYSLVSGFTAGDREVVGLRVLVNAGQTLATSAQISAIVADINAGSAGNGVVAYNPADTLTSPDLVVADNALGGIGTYNLLVHFDSPAAASNYFGFNFATLGTNETSAGLSNINVTDLAVIPEPASVATLALSAAAILLGRRRRQA